MERLTYGPEVARDEIFETFCDLAPLWVESRNASSQYNSHIPLTSRRRLASGKSCKYFSNVPFSDQGPIKHGIPSSKANPRYSRTFG